MDYQFGECIDAMSDNTELSSDEETLLAEIETLKAYEKESKQTQLEDLPIASTPLDVFSLISSGIAEIAPSASNVLILNHLMIHSLKQIEAQLDEKLRNNAYEQEKARTSLRSLKMKMKPTQFPCVQRCGMPFFTTWNGWSQPQNQHTKLQEQQGYLDPIHHFKPVYPWTHADNMKLLKLVTQYDTERKLNALEVKMNKIKKAGGDISEWSELQQEVTAVKSRKCVKIDENIDWLRVAAGMSLEFTPTDCEYQWKYVVSPDINQKPWSVEEIKKLCEVAAKHFYQSWEKIATELGTNRSSLACCFKFQRAMQDQSGPWSIEEDRKLKAELLLYGSVMKVAMLHLNRSVYEIRLRCQLLKKRDKSIGPTPPAVQSTASFWNSLPEKSAAKMGTKYKKISLKDGFSFEKDEALIQAVAKHGTNWDLVVKDVPDVTEDVAKKRYNKLILLIQKTSREVLGQKSPMGLVPTSSENDPLNVLSILKRLASTCKHRAGVFFDSSSTVNKFLEILENMHHNKFGPRAVIPISPSDQVDRVKSLALLCNLFSMNWNPESFLERLKSYVETGEKNIYSGLISSLIKASVKDTTYYDSIYLMPPNVLTLLGSRVLLSARQLLTKQAVLPLTDSNKTVMDTSIQNEDRIRGAKARELLKERMTMLFYLPITLSMFPSTPGTFEVFQQCHKQKSRPLSRLKRKRNASKLSQERWMKKRAKILEEENT